MYSVLASGTHSPVAGALENNAPPVLVLNRTSTANAPSPMSVRLDCAAVAVNGRLPAAGVAPGGSTDSRRSTASSSRQTASVTWRAAPMYFSISNGCTDNVAAALSKPLPSTRSVGSNGRASNGIPNKSCTVYAYSWRFNRRGGTCPGCFGILVTSTCCKVCATQSPNALRLAAGKACSAFSGGISPSRTASRTRSQMPRSRHRSTSPENSSNEIPAFAFPLP